MKKHFGLSNKATKKILFLITAFAFFLSLTQAALDQSNSKIEGVWKITKEAARRNDSTQK